MLAPAEKNLSPGAGEQDDVDVVVHARLEDGLVELAVHLVGVGVGRRIVHLDHGDTVFDAVVDEGLGGFCGGIQGGGHGHPPWGELQIVVLSSVCPPSGVRLRLLGRRLAGATVVGAGRRSSR